MINDPLIRFPDQQQQTDESLQMNLYRNEIDVSRGECIDYGYLTLLITPNDRINGSVSAVYTGSMQIAHFAGSPVQANDELVTTDPFTEINPKLGYTFDVPAVESGIEVFAGVKNLFNEYQNDFDIGKNRNSGYIYGPVLPRTIYAGIRLKSF